MSENCALQNTKFEKQNIVKTYFSFKSYLMWRFSDVKKSGKRYSCDGRALIKTCAFACAYARSLLKINSLPVASDNDRAIFFRGWRRQSFWTGFRLKDKETNLDLWFCRQSRNDTHHLWVRDISVNTRTHTHVWRNTLPVTPTQKKKNPPRAGSHTSGLVGKYAFLDVGSVWKAEVDTSSTAEWTAS